MKNILQFDEIEEVDLELTNVCNLKCPLCLSQQNEFKSIFKPHFADISLLISKLEQFKNVDNVLICGDASEPTLHPQLIQLLDYLKTRKMHVELFTNGSTHDESYWNELNKHFNANSFVCFTIAGIYNCSNAKYRVGSKLTDILKNAHAFKKGNLYKNDHMQYIRFEYNKNEPNDCILDILKQFSSYDIINTDPLCERFKLSKNLQDSGICCDRLFQLKYDIKLKQILKKQHHELCCHNYNKRLIKMDPFGNVYPCILYRLYSNNIRFEYDSYLDYSAIFDQTLSYCYECDKDMVNFLKTNKRDQIYMC